MLQAPGCRASSRIAFNSRATAACGWSKGACRSRETVRSRQSLHLSKSDGRIVFAIPYERNYTLIGTTDQEYSGDPGDIRIDEDEIDYLLTSVNRYLATPVERGQVVWTYSGARPLYDDAKGNASAVTRDYVFDLDVPDDGPPLLSIFGGKLTTYRKLAEHALEKLQPVMGFRENVDRRRHAARRRH